ncbi:hypothetical protein N8612_03670 [Verrucomicrobia bacterium]|nr:hypothetical protein [Verrucomicrobiota bacterium]
METLIERRRRDTGAIKANPLYLNLAQCSPRLLHEWQRGGTVEKSIEKTAAGQ